MKNIWARFKSLNPEPALLAGTVETILADGSRQILLPGGSRILATGESAEGARVFVRAGKIEGEAPDLLVVEVEV